MLEWTEEKPTKPGWYVWFREEYDTMRREFFCVQAPEGDDRPESLRVFPGGRWGRHLDHIVGGVWYGPIPRAPLADREATE